MESENTVCPVCTLFLRPGITLKSHLSSHPKQKVIEALVRISSNESGPKPVQASTSNQTINLLGTSGVTTSNNHGWNPAPMSVNPLYPNFNTMPGNHSFIYQQFMSSSAPSPNVLNVNPLTQQIVTIPTVFNSQMMCPPYVYQQQQVIMSSGPSVMSIVPKPLPIELPPSSCQSRPGATLIEDDNQDDITDEPDLVMVEISELNRNDEIELIEKVNQENVVLDVEKEETEVTGGLGDNGLLHSDSTNRNAIIEQDSEDDADDCNIAGAECETEGGGLPDEMQEYTVKCNVDLSKSCQTQTVNTYGDVTAGEEDDATHLPNEMNIKTDCYYREVQESVTNTTNYTILQNTYDQTQSAYSASSAHAESLFATTRSHQTEVAVDQNSTTNVMDIDGMNLFLNGDFLNGRLVSQVDDYDCNSGDRPRIILNLGDVGTNFDEVDGAEVEEKFDDTDPTGEAPNGEESLSSSSRESAANIRTDEHMPPRGELSGQESNGATSDANWNHRMQYQEMCGSAYDLIARENWDNGSMTPVERKESPAPDWNGDLCDMDANSAQNPPLQQVNTTTTTTTTATCDDDSPTVSGFREPPITYKCPTCGASFNCPKERRVHQREHHRPPPPEKRDKAIAGQIGGKKVRKLLIKPKPVQGLQTTTENNFDNVFTNRLKLETKGEGVKCDLTQPNGELDLQKKEDYTFNTPSVCTICDVVVETTSALKRHQLDVHNLNSDNRHKCKTCEETFPNEAKYTEHLRTHPLECRLCGKFFYRKQNLQLHMKRHLGIKPYKCNICEKAFLTKQKHDEHKNVHTGDMPIKCNMCDETFRRHSNLVQHRNRYHLNIKKKLKDYVCACGDIFHSKRKLAWHKEIHEPKPKSCTHCSEKFIHMSSLTRHIRRAHNERFLPNKERVSENVECPICKGVYLRSYLEVHIRNHSGQKPFACLICNKSFSTKWNLKLHKWTHASRTAKPFKCDQCKGAFIRHSDYVAHMNAHKSVKPYTCNYCGAQFIRKYNCQRHVKEHEKVKTYSCQVCGKSFHRSYYLKDHIRVHSGVRPYTCHICGKTSTTKSNHNKHVRIHHAREPVSTEN